MVVKIGQRWRRQDLTNGDDYIIEIVEITSEGTIYSTIVQKFKGKYPLGYRASWNNDMEGSYNPKYTYLFGQDRSIV